MLPKSPLASAAQTSHRKIAMTTVAASGLATISRNRKVLCFGGRKKSLAAGDFLGYPQKSQEACSDQSCKSPQPRDLAAAATAISRPQRPRDTKPLTRLSFPATEPPEPRRFLKGSLEGFFEVSSYLSQPKDLNPFKTPSRTLRNPFKKVSKSMIFIGSRRGT